MKNKAWSVDKQSPIETVVQAVAAYTNTAPLELPPLYDTLDPDALDVLVQGLGDSEVQFQYAECSVTVHSDGTVDVTGRQCADGAGRERESAE